MVEVVFGMIAGMGLLAALRPQMFTQQFLDERQRERLAGNMGAVSWTGWAIFGCSTFTVMAVLIQDVFGH